MREDYGVAATSPSREWERPMRWAFVVVAVVTLVMGVAANAGAMRPGSDVTIVTEIDFGSPPPFGGTFEVTEGAGLLGCSEGTFVDLQSSYKPDDPTAIFKELTCSDAEGAFTVVFRPTPAPGPGNAFGHWTVTDASGVFSGLHGQGEFFVVVEFPLGVETFSGHARLHP